MHLRIAPGKRAIRPVRDDRLMADAAALAGINAWSCDLDTEALEWTGGVFELFGLAPDCRIDRRAVVELYCESSREMMERLRAQAIRTRGSFTMEAQIRQPGGDIRWMRLVAATQVSNGRAVRLFGMKQDITQEHRQWAQLRRMAENDALTGLANRSRFQSDFLELSAGSDELAAIGALVVFDLDGFKGVNDRWGHAAGDACLTQFAERLALAFPQALLTARIGGDEFAMLLPAPMPAADCEALLRRRMPMLAGPVHWRGKTLQMGVSAGMALASPPGAISPEELFTAADTALYRAKRSGRNMVEVSGGDATPPHLTVAGLSR